MQQDIDDSQAQPVNIDRGGAAVDDPFASQRTADNDPFAQKQDAVGDLGTSPQLESGSPKQDRSMSKEWGWSPPSSCFSHANDSSQMPRKSLQVAFRSVKAPFMPPQGVEMVMSTETNRPNIWRN